MLVFVDGGGKDSLMRGIYGYIVVENSEDEEPISQKFWTNEKLGNDDGLYKAIIKILETANTNDNIQLLCSNSRIVNQINKRWWKIYDARHRNYRQMIYSIETIKELKFTIDFISRKRNRVTPLILDRRGKC